MTLMPHGVAKISTASVSHAGTAASAMRRASERHMTAGRYAAPARPASGMSAVARADRRRQLVEPRADGGELALDVGGARVVPAIAGQHRVGSLEDLVRDGVDRARQAAQQA